MRSRVSACRRELNSHKAVKPRALRPHFRRVCIASEAHHHPLPRDEPNASLGKLGARVKRLVATVPHCRAALRPRHWLSFGWGACCRPVSCRWLQSAQSGTRSWSYEAAQSWQANRLLPPGAAWPNPSFKPSPNSVARRTASAGPAAHFALAVQRATLSVPA